MIQTSVPFLVEGKAYVPGLPREHVSERYGIPLDDIAKLGSAENPYGASPKAVEAVNRAIQTLDIYPDWTARALRVAIAEKYGFDPDCVVCGAGETEVISMVIRAFAGPQDTILMHDPCFPIYHIYSKCEGRNPLFVKMGEDFDPVIDQYIDALATEPRIAFITNPHNPSGRLLDETQLRRICDAASEKTLVVLDEAYIHYSETPGSMHLLRDYSNLILLRTFSKAHGLAGLRIGFGVAADPALVRPLWNIKPTWNMGNAQIAGGVAAINDDAHVERAVKTISEMREYVKTGLESIDAFRMVPGSRSNFFLLEIIDTRMDSSSVFHGLLQRGVIVKDGRDIAGVGSRHLRIDFNLQRHMDRLLWALTEIADVNMVEA